MRYVIAVLLLLVVVSPARAVEDLPVPTLQEAMYQEKLDMMFIQILELQKLIMAYLDTLGGQSNNQTVVTAKATSTTTSAVIDYRAKTTRVTLAGDVEVKEYVIASIDKTVVLKEIAKFKNTTAKKVAGEVIFSSIHGDDVAGYEFVIAGPTNMRLETRYVDGSKKSETVPREAINNIVEDDFYGSESAYKSMLDDIVVGIKQGEKPSTIVSLVQSFFKITEKDFVNKLKFEVGNY